MTKGEIKIIASARADLFFFYDHIYANRHIKDSIDKLTSLIRKYEILESRPSPNKPVEPAARKTPVCENCAELYDEYDHCLHGCE